MTYQDKIKKIVELLKNSNYATAFTGAGISTESGIPDFRSKNGIYSYVSENIFSLELFYKKPEVFYEFASKYLFDILSKKPNKAHIVLAKLEQKGYLKCVITQNIDNLHQKAGSKRVYEVHGSFNTSTCLRCGKKFDFNYLVTELKNKKIPVLCDECKGVIKPDVTFFGESLPEDFTLATAEAQKSDFMFVLGTSLVVYPAAFIPTYVNGSIVIVNKEETPLDSRAEVVIHDSLTKVFADIEEYMNL